jgi:hypothetical protein
MLRKPSAASAIRKFVLAKAPAATPAAVVFNNDLRDNIPCRTLPGLSYAMPLSSVEEAKSRFVY